MVDGFQKEIYIYLVQYVLTYVFLSMNVKVVAFYDGCSRHEQLNSGFGAIKIFLFAVETE